MTAVTVVVSTGELIDKMTILEIKSERIGEPDKLVNVRAELKALQQAKQDQLPASSELASLTGELKAVNETLWDIENDVRKHEHGGTFNDRFVELSRAVYHNNDKRSAIKRRINEITGSQIVEEKSYAPY